MKKYWLVAKLSLQDVLTYKLDFFLSSAKYALMILMMTIVWLAVEQNGQVGFMNRQETISYFLLSALLYSLSNFHPWYIEDDIRLGYLSKFLVKPISVNAYHFCFEFAKTALDTTVKMIIFLLILQINQLLPETSLTRAILFLIYCPFIFLFSFQWLTLVSTLAFWITEAYAVRWAVSIFTRLLSGVLVPIVYFPEVSKNLLAWLPFQHLAFTPIQFVQNKISYQTFLISFVTLFLWTVALTAFKNMVWKKGVFEYEGGGI